MDDARLIALGEAFMKSFNSRDFARAAELYAPAAIYESASLVSEENPAGQIHGREAILAYFGAALAEDLEFHLTMVDQFPGASMTVVVSTVDGLVFIDVLRCDDKGLIVHHGEVSPKKSVLLPPS